MRETENTTVESTNYMIKEIGGCAFTVSEDDENGYGEITRYNGCVTAKIADYWHNYETDEYELDEIDGTLAFNDIEELIAEAYYAKREGRLAE